MPVTILSKQIPFLETLNGKTRDARNNGTRLAKIHREIGRILGQHHLSRKPFRTKPTTTVQDKRSDISVLDTSDLTIVALLRAGLYVAEGVRDLLDEAPHHYLLSRRPDDLDLRFIDGKDVLLVDAVINTGKSIEAYIQAAAAARSIACFSIVMQDEFRIKAEDRHRDIAFITSRVSENAFVGRGQTDTGNRLFGTI
ncbi:uracil phosphoribosyltransferase [Jhaorihella thermophila]|uniref:Uracil phosphoribosyltransferase n=1 Tax=Jhaorihella thermophila TaxID=488547 RepID=A0A1H5YKI1_9RHOB|nr:uracil phosphoribosyltransferase [Jhaorihella thermophila]SEG24172.1 uracil phosphoribosyltransferase [Jhaorihella thermophila]